MRRLQGGSILILALWVLFFLAALTVAAAGHVWAVLASAERLQDRALAYMQAHSAAAWAVAVIEQQHRETGEGTNHWDGLSPDAWNRDAARFRVPLSGDESGAEQRGEVYFAQAGEDVLLPGVTGEEGRLDLNRASRDRLHALFAYVGGARGDALAVQLFGPASPLHGGLTGGGEQAYDRPTFLAVEDLLLVEGMDDALYEVLAPHLTVFGGGTLLNINCASRAVLVAFLFSTGQWETLTDAEVLADAILAERTIRGFSDSADFRARLPEVPGELLGRGLDFASTAYRGIAVGPGMGRTETGLEIEFVWDTIARRYVLWRER